MRDWCMELISKLEINKKNALFVWKCAVDASNEVLRQESAVICACHWDEIGKSKELDDLSKESMLELCNDIALILRSNI